MCEKQFNSTFTKWLIQTSKCMLEHIKLNRYRYKGKAQGKQYIIYRRQCQGEERERE